MYNRYYWIFLNLRNLIDIKLKVQRSIRHFLKEKLYYMSRNKYVFIKIALSFFPKTFTNIKKKKLYFTLKLIFAKYQFYPLTSFLTPHASPSSILNTLSSLSFLSMYYQEGQDEGNREKTKINFSLISFSISLLF